MSKKSRDKDIWIGFDLGGTKMLAVAFDSSFSEIGKIKRQTKANLGAAKGVQRIIGTIHQALENAKMSPRQIKGIGVGSPGPLDLRKGIILEAPNLGWKNVDLKMNLEKEFKCPAVIANDVDAGTYGEYRFGAAQKARCVVGVFPGTGIGGGCVYHGEIIQGERNSCMEIGHLPVMPEGALSGCGLQGTLESVASRLSISAAVAAAAYRGEAPYLMSHAGTDLKNIRSGMIAESIKQGDITVEKIVYKSAQWIGYTMAGVVHLLSPDIILLGGGLVEAMPDLFIEAVSDTINKHLLPSFHGTFKIKIATLGDDAVVKGAAALSKKLITADK